jgi:hypothetical protein
VTPPGPGKQSAYCAAADPEILHHLNRSRHKTQNKISKGIRGTKTRRRTRITRIPAVKKKATILVVMMGMAMVTVETISSEDN